MIANIELKSLDFEDENFSPVFNRTKEEFFLQPSEKYLNDMQRVFAPLRGLSYEHVIDKYLNIKPNHTFFREWPITKFVGGFGLGYILLRELPIRNFYARGFIMWVFLAKLSDHLTSFIPYHGYFKLYVAEDQYTNEDVNNYNNVYHIQNFIDIPSALNRVSEGKLWNAKQPGHLRFNDLSHISTFLKTRTRHTAHWVPLNL
jgi:hypothetical protein